MDLTGPHWASLHLSGSLLDLDELDLEDERRAPRDLGGRTALAVRDLRRVRSGFRVRRRVRVGVRVQPFHPTPTPTPTPTPPNHPLPLP